MVADECNVFGVTDVQLAENTEQSALERNLQCYWTERIKQPKKITLNLGATKIKCNNCDATYIGQSGRSFNTRLKVQIYSINNKKETTRIVVHSIQLRHNIDNSFLHYAEKSKKLSILKSLAILKTVNVVNNQWELNMSDSRFLISKRL